ncbi:MAG: DUF1838 domain-containing protein [Gammaproteobacteria bacterium]|nr:DUF1838 domain-containing protein [Gammaproteobacteria bacterium]MYB37390.1 DUF1838 domain-containing protein [Gammaproteobacteria bacterium]
MKHPLLKQVSCALFAVALLYPATARELDPNDPLDALTISRKIMCSTVDGQPTTFWWEGRAFSRRQGERDRHLFDVEGMNVRACVADNHAERGSGFRMVSRELLIYRDPASGAALATWDNPWTGATVEVLHVANDPVNFAMYEKDPRGAPMRWSGHVEGGLWRQTTTVPLFYPNPLGGGFQSEVGGTYHATEMFNFFGAAAELLDADGSHAGSHVGWARMSDWLPWMKMGGREGVIYMHTSGLRLDSWEALPASMREEIATHYPEYTEPPALDDERGNVTSWIYYRRVREGVEQAPARGDP